MDFHGAMVIGAGLISEIVMRLFLLFESYEEDTFSELQTQVGIFPRQNTILIKTIDLAR